MWHFVYSSKQRCREEFTWLYTMRANPRATSIWRQHTASGRWLRDIAPDVLHAIRHAPIFYPVLHPGCKTLYLFIPFICYSGDESQQRSFHMHSNDTETQNWQARRLEHRFSFHHLLLAVRPPPQPLFPWKCAAIPDPIVTSVSTGQGKKKKEKKRGGAKKSSENDDFSLLKLGPVVCNLLRHSTSSASLFNNFAQRGTLKKKGLQAGENMVAGAYSITEY